MRKLIVNTFLSLDGVMQPLGGPEEDRSRGFQLGGWSVNYWDNKVGERMVAFMGKPFDLLLGRKGHRGRSGALGYMSKRKRLRKGQRAGPA